MVSDGSDGSDAADSFLHRLSLVIAQGVWAVVGFYLWIPIVVFGVIRHSFTLLASVLNNDKSQPGCSQDFLSGAMAFYSKGFTRVSEAGKQRFAIVPWGGGELTAGDSFAVFAGLFIASTGFWITLGLAGYYAIQ